MGVFVRIVVRSGGGVGGVVRDEGEEGKKGEGVKEKCAGSGQFGVGWYGVDHPRVLSTSECVLLRIQIWVHIHPDSLHVFILVWCYRRERRGGRVSCWMGGRITTMSEFAVTSTRRHTWFDDPAQPLTASFPPHTANKHDENDN